MTWGDFLTFYFKKIELVMQHARNMKGKCFGSQPTQSTALVDSESTFHHLFPDFSPFLSNFEFRVPLFVHVCHRNSKYILKN